MKSARTSMFLVGLLCLSPVLEAAETTPAPVVLGEGRGVEIDQILSDYAKRANKRLIVDPRVRAYVIAPGVDLRTVSFSDLQAILRVHGFVAVDEQDVITVIPEANMRQLPLVNLDSRGAARVGDDNVVLRVINVEKIDAAQLVPLLRPLLPQAAHMAVYAPTNSMILVGRYANVRTIEAIVHSMEKQPVRAAAPAN